MVRIRMKSMGRRHRPFFRICAMDSRSGRDGRAIEELGHHDPMVRNVDARTVLKADRIRYWLSVGASPARRSRPCSSPDVKKPANGEHWNFPSPPRPPPPAGPAHGPRPLPATATRRRRNDPPKPPRFGHRRIGRMAKPLRFDVLTLFPGLLDGFLDESILKRAIAKGLVEVRRTTSAASPRASTIRSTTVLSGAGRGWS